MCLTHACFGCGWSGATAVDDFGKNCWITLDDVPPPFVALRVKATGVDDDGICLGYCLIGTFDPLLSELKINSRSIWIENGREKRR